METARQSKRSESVWIGSAGDASRRAPAGPRSRRFDAFPYLMSLPAFIVVLVILGFPVGYNIYIGFTNASAFTGLDNPAWIGLENYTWVFTDPKFWDAVRITLVWTTSSLTLQICLGMILALILHQIPIGWSRVLQPIWLIPWVLPSVSVFYVWRLYFNPQIGPIQRFLEAIHLVDRPILANPDLALWGIVLAGLWKGFPFYMVVFHSALQSVPQDLYDAARVDGANRPRIFWSVERPAILSVAVPASVLGFVWIFNWFTPMFAMTEGGPGGATTTVGMYIYFESLRGFRYNTAAAASTGLVAVVVVLFATYQLINWRAVRSGAATA
ncbi:MAG: sugar ABC transporter permease [Thermomicrobiales bacterium]|nr:sugar ABC transporter permease [Thermomicrobiales bacterium]